MALGSLSGMDVGLLNEFSNDNTGATSGFALHLARILVRPKRHKTRVPEVPDLRIILHLFVE
jgi:hypothetical protein